MKFCSVKNLNEILIKENHAEIVLKNNKHEEVGRALIDLEDVEKIKQFSWYSHRNYAETSIFGKGNFYLHRYILNGLNSYIHIDHKNHNTLDNRKDNLRLCSNTENHWNMKKVKIGTSKYKGVSWFTKHGKWKSQICCKSKRFNLGLFTNEEEAALAYNKKAKELFGEFAYLNVVKPKLKLRKKLNGY